MKTMLSNNHLKATKNQSKTSFQDKFSIMSLNDQLNLTYANALLARFPTVPSVPSNSSVTLWEETAPVKLPTIHCPQPG